MSVRRGNKPNATRNSPPATSESDQLDSLNSRRRRRADSRKLIEASIEANAKKRRTHEAPASSTFKPSV